MKKVCIFALGLALALGLGGVASALGLPEGFALNIDLNADLSPGKADTTDFALSKGFALSKVEVHEPVSINNINFQGHP